MDAYNIPRAIEIANALRAAFNKPLIGDLPPGEPKVAKECVLARAFNFDCFVGRDGSDDGWMVGWLDGDHEAQAYKLAEILGVEPEIQRCHVPNCTSCPVKVLVPLPADVGEIASQFDKGLLPDAYYLSKQEAPS